MTVVVDRERAEEIAQLIDQQIILYQWATMVKRGVSILESLSALRVLSDRFEQDFASINLFVESGTNLGEAMRDHGKNFSPFVARLIKAGEESGYLKEALAYAIWLSESIVEILESGRDVCLFTLDCLVDYKMLSMLIKTGLPNIRCVQVVVDFPAPTKLSTDYWAMVAQELEGGATLSSAMAIKRGGQDPFFSELVKVGEQAGKLDLIFPMITSFYEDLVFGENTVVEDFKAGRGKVINEPGFSFFQAVDDLKHGRGSVFKKGQRPSASEKAE